jgi:hypothetical protein
MRHTMIRSAAMGAAALAVAWVTLTDTPDLAAQGRGRGAGAGAAPAAATSKPAPMRDVNGVWMKGRAPQGMPTFDGSTWTPGIQPPLTALGQEMRAKNKPNNSGEFQLHETNDPVLTKCYPPGVPRVYFHPYPFEFVQVKNAVLQVFEYDHFLRRMWTDGRAVPTDPEPLWMGTSVGRWTNDTTLEVVTVGFNDKTWIDRAGAPHSDQLKVTERFRRVDFDHLEMDMIIEDAKTLAKPWTSKGYFDLRPDWEIGEISCSGDYLEWPGA